MLKRMVGVHGFGSTSIVVLACVVLAGCEVDPFGEGGSSEPVPEATLRVLAQQYLFIESPPNEIDSLMISLRGLSPEDSVRLFDQLRVLQGVPATAEAATSPAERLTIEMDEAISRLALEARTNRLLLPMAEVRQRLLQSMGVDIDAAYTRPWRAQDTSARVPEPAAICLPGYDFCTVAAFDENGFKYNACQGGCITGNGFDRVSNEGCELGACDYRVWYPTGAIRANRVDGTTPAASCVVNSWPTLLNSYLGGYTRVLYGWGHTTACGVFSGTTLQGTTRAWKM